MSRVIVIASETMGRGSDELGAVLVGSFLRKLAADEAKPAAIVLYNAGVKLTTEGSAVLDALGLLARAGVDIVSCQTCLEHYGLERAVKVGRVGNMQGIVAMLMRSETVVTI
ncbi:MAG: sulfurtransferase-like selenium metabolism protein YedF [Candidatus Eisenbacteria bacterium]|nr:sulfurtransferase-like selenium metabolism protein YedF [Candidatus Eisenbacteria bacterium]